MLQIRSRARRTRQPRRLESQRPLGLAEGQTVTRRFVDWLKRHGRDCRLRWQIPAVEDLMRLAYADRTGIQIFRRREDSALAVAAIEPPDFGFQFGAHVPRLVSWMAGVNGDELWT